MLKANLRKIKSEPKAQFLAVAVLLIAASVLLWTLVNVKDNELRSLTTGTTRYELEIADTEAEQAKGLGGRRQLAADKGMLFVYDRQDVRCFWMKDTLIPLDIIWIDAGRTVTQIEAKLSPDTYPRQYCAAAQYVIELRAGEARKSNITVDTKLSF